MTDLSKTIKITRPISSLKTNTVQIPGSKYLANRLLVIASLAKGKSVIHNMPDNADIAIVREAMEKFGAKISLNSKAENSWKIEGTGGFIKSPKSAIYTGENGTFSRFAVAVAALSHEKVTLDSALRMKERPMEEILSALSELGVKVESKENSFPIKTQGPLQCGEVSLKGNTSSQYFSALLITLPYAFHKKDYDNQNNLATNIFSTIHASTPIVSENYINLTCELMGKFGINVEVTKSIKKNSYLTMKIPSSNYAASDYSIEPDPVSATYFMAIGALSNESIIIKDYNPNSIQGEALFPEVLRSMGCEIEYINDKTLNGLKISPPKAKTNSHVDEHNKLKAITVDMSNMPDAVQTLAVIAANANGKTRINGIAHLRYKESNRIDDTATELKKCGIKVKTGKDFMEIEGGIPCPALLDGHNDHRMVMSLSLLSLRTYEIKIKGYQAVEKSFPLFFEQLKELGFTLIY